MAQLHSAYDSRVRIYMEALQLYENYQARVTVPFHELTDEHVKAAVEDPALLKAEAGFREAIEMCRQGHHLPDMATGLYELGLLLHMQGRLAEAKECFHAVLRLQSGFAQVSMESTQVSSGAEYHLGVLAMKSGNRIDAQYWLNRAVKKDSAAGDFTGLAIDRMAMKKFGISEESATEQDTPLDDTGDAELSTHADFLPPQSEDGELANNSLFATDIPLWLGAKSSSPDSSPSESESFKIPNRGPWQTDTVWIVAYTHDAANDLRARIESLIPEFPCKTLVKQTVFRSDGVMGDPAAKAAADPQLCAVILVIEPSALADESYRNQVAWCVNRVADREDFRLYVCLRNISLEEMHALALDQTQPEISGLIDGLLRTVHLAESPDSESIRSVLLPFLRKLDEVRKQRDWWVFRLLVLANIGMVARKAQALGLMTLGVVSCMYVIQGLETVTAALHGMSRLWIGLLLMVPVFRLAAGHLFLFTQRGEATVMGRQGGQKFRSSLFFRLTVGSFLIFCAIDICFRLGVPGWDITLGAILGMTLDVVRRLEIQGKRSIISIQEAHARVVSGDAADFSESLLGQSQDNGEFIPNMPPAPATAPRIFISYTHASPTMWSANTALWFHGELTKMGADAFLDRAEIAVGSNWPSVLGKRLGEAHVFLVVIDRGSLQKPWVAAEVVAALLCQRDAFLPEIVVVAEPGLSTEDCTSAIPIIRGILERRHGTQLSRRLRVVNGTSLNLHTLLSGLRPHIYYTKGLIPHGFWIVIQGCMIPFTAFATIGPAIGALLGLTEGILWCMGGPAIPVWMHSHGWMGWFLIVLSFLLSSTLRLKFSLDYEVSDPNAKRAGCAYFAGLAGLSYLLIGSLPLGTPITWGWVAVALFFGWFTGDIFIKVVGRTARGFLKK